MDRSIYIGKYLEYTRYIADVASPFNQNVSFGFTSLIIYDY